ncbi:amidohydrolase [Sphingomicrobium astaxanthinifaciens]|uniref:amidohydrolase n=1 Tax=Sphingomicrobium astaxanthinifaciens TaxID=1227949 RepID=UPI001FCB49CC|nr:amidohydrolase [Sphingomicrobium astaxanthinifaciens]MCJ7421691.1 amidohydrolase [Sphingomicrobium astaxanthinifaciens]
MTRKLLLAASAALAPIVLGAAPTQADTLYVNADGLHATAEGTLERFAAMRVDERGRIVRLYAPGEALDPAADERVDLGGAHVLPGLIDAHGHVMGLGLALLQLDLGGTASIEELQRRVAAYAAANPDLPWIVGRGWNQELFAEGRFPTAADLDAVVADRPVWLGRVDGHAAVGNSRALAIAGITAATPDPEGGAIERLADGSPAGVFIDTAEALVNQHIPAPDAALFDRALEAAERFMLANGLTAVADMGTSVEDWHAMRRAGDAGELDVRIMSYSANVGPAQAIAGTAPTPWLYGDRLRMGGVKLYSDGALGSRGALLKADYADQHGHRGLPVMSPAELRAAADWAADHDFQLAIHAIGDAANAEVIAILEELDAPAERHRIEHVQILDPADLGRLAEAGIIASMQPVHQTSDWQMAEKRLGPDRLGGAYAWKSLHEAGTRLAFGSDFPVEHPNPFVGLKVAVTREDANGAPRGGWRAHEVLSLGQALAGFTQWAAYAGEANERFGALAPGRHADFIIVDRDISAGDPRAIADTKVLATYVGGEKVWSAD